MKNKAFNWEIYTNKPGTKQGGWEIKFVSVFADTRDKARELLKEYPNFDCIIRFNYEAEFYQMDEDQQIAYANGETYYQTL